METWKLAQLQSRCILLPKFSPTLHLVLLFLSNLASHLSLSTSYGMKPSYPSHETRGHKMECYYVQSHKPVNICFWPTKTHRQLHMVPSNIKNFLGQSSHITSPSIRIYGFLLNFSSSYVILSAGSYIFFFWTQTTLSTLFSTCITLFLDFFLKICTPKSPAGITISR